MAYKTYGELLRELKNSDGTLTHIWLRQGLENSKVVGAMDFQGFFKSIPYHPQRTLGEPVQEWIEGRKETPKKDPVDICDALRSLDIDLARLYSNWG